MGMTVWVHILDGRKIVGNQQDCSWLAELAEPLDAICEQRGVGKLSGYFDYTDLQHNMGEGGDPDAEPDPETGWAWGIDDMKWFPASGAVRTLQALKSTVPEAGPIGKLPAARVANWWPRLTIASASLSRPPLLARSSIHVLM